MLNLRQFFHFAMGTFSQDDKGKYLVKGRTRASQKLAKVDHAELDSLFQLEGNRHKVSTGFTGRELPSFLYPFGGVGIEARKAGAFLHFNR